MVGDICMYAICSESLSSVLHHARSRLACTLSSNNLQQSQHAFVMLADQLVVDDFVHDALYCMSCQYMQDG